MLNEKDIEDYKGDNWPQPLTTKSGMPEIDSNRMHTNESMSSRIQNLKRENAEQMRSTDMAFQTKNWTDYGASLNAPSVGQEKPSTSTTAMQQAEQGTGYAGPVTSPSGLSRGQNGSKKPTDTWTDTVGTKFDHDKPPMALLDSDFLEGVARVLGFGSNKYAADNWRNGIAVRRLISASYRHLGAINKGEDIDSESGLPHSYHLGCCVMFLASMLQNRPDLDDRWKA